jgi:transcriptional regulator with XRE-family HTH domain
MNWSILIEALLKDFRLSEYTLAEKTGIRQTTIYALRKGKTKEPQPRTIEKIERALGIKIDDRDQSDIKYETFEDSPKTLVELSKDQFNEYPIILESEMSKKFQGIASEGWDDLAKEITASVKLPYNKENCLAAVIETDNNVGLFNKGDYVLGHLEKPERVGKYYGIVLKDGDYFLGKLERATHTHLLFSFYNRRYAIREIEKKDVSLAGRIVFHWREM